MRASRREAEFEAWVLGSRAGLVRTATVICAGDGHLAEDLVQIALARLFAAWPRIRPDGAKAYARRVIVNLLIDEKRRPSSKREQLAGEVPDEAPDQDPAGDDGALLAGLATLPVGMRTAVVLRYVDGLSVEETAHAMRCSPGTVRSQAARGLSKLRDLFPPVPAGRTAPIRTTTRTAPIRTRTTPIDHTTEEHPCTI